MDTMRIGRRDRQHDGLCIGWRCALKTVREFVLDISGGDIAGPEARFIHDRGAEWHIVLNALNVEPVQGFGLNVQSLITIFAMGDQFGDHRIIEHRDLVAFADTAIHTHGAARERTFHRRDKALETTN